MAQHNSVWPAGALDGLIMQGKHRGSALLLWHSSGVGQRAGTMLNLAFRGQCQPEFNPGSSLFHPASHAVGPNRVQILASGVVDLGKGQTGPGSPASTASNGVQ